MQVIIWRILQRKKYRYWEFWCEYCAETLAFMRGPDLVPKFAQALTKGQKHPIQAPGELPKTFIWYPYLRINLMGVPF